MTKRLVKAPKLYFLDTGLCAWLTEWTSPQTLEAGAASGAILETWILGELLKSWWHQGRRTSFYFYRDRDQREVDLLIVQDDTSTRWNSRNPRRRAAMRRGISVRSSKLGRPLGPGGVICLAPTSLPLADGVVTIPVGAI